MKTRNNGFPFGFALILIVTAILAFVLYQNFGTALAVKAVVIGIVTAIAWEVRILAVGYLYRKMGVTTLVWIVLVALFAIVFALTGLLKWGSPLVSELKAHSQYISIERAKTAPIVYELYDDGRFGLPDASGLPMYMGTIQGTTLTWSEGNRAYTIIPFSLLSDGRTQLALGPDVALVHFIPKK